MQIHFTDVLNNIMRLKPLSELLGNEKSRSSFTSLAHSHSTSPPHANQPLCDVTNRHHTDTR